MPSRSKLQIRKSRGKSRSKSHRKQHNKRSKTNKNSKKRIIRKNNTLLANTLRNLGSLKTSSLTNTPVLGNTRNQRGGFDNCSLATVQESGFTIPGIGDVSGFSLSQSKGAIYRPNCKSDNYQAMAPS